MKRITIVLATLFSVLMPMTAFGQAVPNEDSHHHRAGFKQCSPFQTGVLHVKFIGTGFLAINDKMIIRTHDNVSTSTLRGADGAMLYNWSTGDVLMKNDPTYYIFKSWIGCD